MTARTRLRRPSPVARAHPAEPGDGPAVLRARHVLGSHARSSILGKVLRQSFLLVAFCVLLLGGLSFFYITWLLPDAQPALSAYSIRTLGFTILIVSGLLLLLALFLSTLLARDLARPLATLSEKVGAIRPGSWSFRRTLQSGDELETLDAVIADLTSRLRDAYSNLEEKVEERTRQFREEYARDHAILESIEYGVLAIDQSGVVTDANPAACRLLQQNRQDVVGRLGATALPLLQRKGRPLPGEHPIEHVLHLHKTYRSHPALHLSLLRPDQSSLPVTLLVVPLSLGPQSFGALAVFQDETLERQIDYMKSEFISLASHQLRTPLASIRWYVEMLSHEKGKFSEDHRSWVGEIDVASQRMANLLEALLHVARLDDGAITPDKRKVDLVDLLKRLSEVWMPAADEKKTALHLELSQAHINVVTDPVLLEIVLQNLFTNALKYSPVQKDITVTVIPGDTEIRITVRDLGMGIPKAEQPRIFQKFFRAHNVRTMDTDGTGLGLYMSKAIIEHLGGSLAFESEEGKGTLFTVTLPVK